MLKFFVDPIIKAYLKNKKRLTNKCSYVIL